MEDRQKYAIELATDIMKKHINQHYNMALGNREAGVMVGYGEAINILSDMLLSDSKHTHDLKDNKNYYKWTNADRIRTMTDEELAEWVTNMCQFEKDEEPYRSIYNLDTEKEEEIHDSYGDLLNWLQSEAE